MDKPNLFQEPNGEDEIHAYHTPLEQKVKAAISPFQAYINEQVIAGGLLLACTVIALLWATGSPTYSDFIQTPIGITVGNWQLEKSLRFWSNDILLTLFFFVVGLEIKREFLVGELADPRKASFIISAAIGGMVMPALLFLYLNYNTPTLDAWGIPIATDTAFALGILNCFKRKLPNGVFTFMAALAILDDIGAILVIAFVYSSNLQVVMLLLALGLSFILLLINYAGFRRPAPYVLLGILIWFCIESANIHGTVAGILIAFLIPARPQKGPAFFIKKIKHLIAYFEKRKAKNPLILEDEKQHATIEQVQQVAIQATTPLQRWGSNLSYPISILVLPLFTLTNAGIPLSIHLMKAVFSNPLSLGILAGLFIGKPIGITVSSWLALKLKFAQLPENTSFANIMSVAVLTGIGFTMSLFIANQTLANSEALLLLGKSAILLSSLLSCVLGIVLLGLTVNRSATHH